MTTWILIITVYLQGAVITQMSIESEEMCEKAGKLFVAAQPMQSLSRYVCVKGWEITND
jgi:hypothetical protein